MKDKIKDGKYYSVMAKIKPSKKPIKKLFGVFDIENSGDNSQNITSIALYYRIPKMEKRKLVYIEKSDYFSDDTSDNIKKAAWERMKEITLTYSSQKKLFYWYAHNSEYDTGGILGNTIKHFTQGDNQCLYNGGRLIVAKEKIGEREITYNGELKKKNIYLIICDSMNLLTMPVAKIGESIGIEKLKVDYNNLLEDKEKLKEYNITDCKIVYKGIEYLENFLNSMGTALSPYTIGSNALKLYKTKFLPSWLNCEEEINKKFFEAFAGGRTEVFNYNILENGYYYDVNSLYPSVMLDNFYPDLSKEHKELGSYYFEGKDQEEQFFWLFSKYCGGARISGFMPENHLSPYWVKAEKLYFCFGEIKNRFFTFPEIYQMILAGLQDFQISECVIWPKTNKLFKDWIDKLYGLRLEFKKQDNPMQLIVKLFLNSLYGKFCQKNNIKEYGENFIVARERAEEKHKGLNFHDFVEISDDGFGYIQSDELLLSEHTLSPIGAYVTAYARLSLMKYMKQAEEAGATIYYCDTDSVFIDKPVFRDSKKLGDMKLECKVKWAEFYSPKVYQYIDENNKHIVKIKGAGVKNFECDNQKIYYKNIDKPVNVFIKYKSLRDISKIEVLKPVRSRTGINTGKQGKWEWQEKVIDWFPDSDKIKRIINNDNTTFTRKIKHDDFSMGVLIHPQRLKDLPRGETIFNEEFERKRYEEYIRAEAKAELERKKEYKQMIKQYDKYGVVPDDTYDLESYYDSMLSVDENYNELKKEWQKFELDR